MIDEISVKAFTQGDSVPSTRFRVDYLKHGLRASKINISVSNAHESAYPPSNHRRRLLWAVKEVFFRFLNVCGSFKYDVVILQREMISTIPTLERFTKKPRILDVDDAIWIRRSGWAADEIAKRVDHIVCGNSYIAEYFRKFGKPVSIIATPVDVDRFFPVEKKCASKVIGWSGTSGGFKFLYDIEDALAQVLEENQDWKLRIVSDQRPNFNKIPAHAIEYVQWAVENEVDSIATMDIGLMPLDDTEWSRGKCSYKMLLYMACCIPVVVSDFGMNREILKSGFIGFGAIGSVEWYQSLTALINNPLDRDLAGRNARDIVVERYSLNHAINEWERVIRSTLKNKLMAK